MPARAKHTYHQQTSDDSRVTTMFPTVHSALTESNKT